MLIGAMEQNTYDDGTVWHKSYRNLPSGWDDGAIKIYNRRAESIQYALMNDESSVQEINIVPTSQSSSFRVYNNSKIDAFWDRLNVIPVAWEPDTFEIYFKFLDSHTILIDFGTWIGPTILYGAQYASAVYGIEGDPAAYAEAAMNIQLNNHKLWYKNIHLQPGVICTQQDIISNKNGILKMKTHSAGNSGSGIGQHVAGETKGISTWNVQCYSLETLMNYWGILYSIHKHGQKVLIKIDIESYECKLIPDFYEWLNKIPQNYLPIFFISYHPQISKCSHNEFKGFAKIIKLYKISECYGATQNIHQRLMIDSKTDFKIIFDQIKYCNSVAERGATFTLWNE